MKFSIAAVAASIVLSSAFAFTPISVRPLSTTKVFSTVEEEIVAKEAVEEVVKEVKITKDAAEEHEEGGFVRGPVIVEKPTGTSFLPEETLERCAKGNPTEKAKLKKDPIHSWIDIYDYAKRIRDGEMTWKEVEKADLDTVSHFIYGWDQSRLLHRST